MFHYIDHIIKASDEVLVQLAADARRRAENGTGFGYVMNQKLIAEACEDELAWRKRKREKGGMADE